MYNKIQKTTIILLCLFYFCLNIYNSKICNIIAFCVCFALSLLFLKNKFTSLIIAYILCVSYNIIKNFHLIENFEEATNSPNLEKNINKISDKLLEGYINKVKIKNPRLISTRQVKISELIPTKKELFPEKVKDMKLKEHLKDIPIVINDDNFIIDGHYRWYINKNNNNKFIVAIIVKQNLKEFYKELKEYKKDTNAEELNKFTLDKEKISNAKKSIENIMESINVLNESMKDLDKINVV